MATEHTYSMYTVKSCSFDRRKSKIPQPIVIKFGALDDNVGQNLQNDKS